MSLSVYRLTGRITDFNGKPVDGAVVKANGVPGIATATDSQGRYDLWLPDTRIPALMAYDFGYGKTTLECWAYDYHPRDDLVLDMRIGQLEVYELHAWRGYCGIKADFLPMSIGMVDAVSAERKTRGDRAKSISPSLAPHDIEATIDGRVVDILSVHSRDEVQKTDGTDHPAAYSRREYSLQLANSGDPSEAERGNIQVLRVALRHQYKKDGHSVIERGEGIYLGLAHGLGVSGGSG